MGEAHFILLPNSDISTFLDPSPVRAHYLNVGKAAIDDASYNYKLNDDADNNWDIHGCNNRGGLEIGPISLVRVYARMKSTFAGAYGTIGLVTGGSLYWAAAASSLTTGFADYYKDWALNPKTGVAWTWPDIDAINLAEKLHAAAAETSFCSRLWGDVTFNRDAARKMIIF
jgi:hypothetical protein